MEIKTRKRSRMRRARLRWLLGALALCAGLAAADAQLRPAVTAAAAQAAARKIQRFLCFMGVPPGCLIWMQSHCTTGGADWEAEKGPEASLRPLPRPLGELRGLYTAGRTA